METKTRSLMVNFATVLLALIVIVAMILPLANTASAENSVRYIWPTSCHTVTGHWGYESGHYHPYHYGIDIGASGGAKVYASASGTVIAAGNVGSGYGYRIQIKHSDGTVTLYAHLKAGSIKVSKGDSVSAGNWIASVGNTGGNYGYHLHFGIYKSVDALGKEDGRDADDISLDPEQYLENWLNVTSYANSTTGKPVISWTTYPGVAKYKIYRKTASAKEYTYITTTKNRSYTYSNAKPTYGYYFKVNAYNSSGKLLKSTTKYQICKISKPTITDIYKANDKIYIKYKGQLSANQYKLYRATSANGPYKCIYTSAAKSGCDKGGEAKTFIVGSGTEGTTYYFRVAACHSKYTAANSALSNYGKIVR